MDKLDYLYQDAWQHTTKEVDQSPIDIQTKNLKKGDCINVDWQGIGPSALTVKEKVIGDQYYCEGQLTLEEKQYQLERFHTHQGYEHLIDGQSGPAEIHLVFKRPDGGTMVLGIWTKLDEQAPILFEPVFLGRSNTIELMDMVPKNLKSVYTYTGTLTTPPLKEDVHWVLLKEKLGINPVDVAAFAQAYPHNVRSVQPLNGREVLLRNICSV
ncbi:carbonic anhydrase family protein [Fructobacillus sp. M2-14]|uniref:carbonic anhydrase n=1 Tax=Fructobacillus broussonetiae TaxID=2713173 RepID=A0ABS5QZR6_9LACO|nr:carbonic anhydrase family protein [Fructobacillus broussonetiae]MBS9338698.1 carbonic anhydrase family protein [Fructobacillus broussonetiae]